MQTSNKRRKRISHKDDKQESEIESDEEDEEEQNDVESTVQLNRQISWNTLKILKPEELIQAYELSIQREREQDLEIQKLQEALFRATAKI